MQRTLLNKHIKIQCRYSSTHTCILVVRAERSTTRPGRFNSNYTDTLDRRWCGSQLLKTSCRKIHSLPLAGTELRPPGLYKVTILNELPCNLLVYVKNCDLSHSFLTLNMMFQTIKFIDDGLLVFDSDILQRFILVVVWL